MKILQICNYTEPVPPKKYGGVERYLNWLCCGLTERGHEVTLVAHKDSYIPGVKLIPFAPSEYGSGDCRRVIEKVTSDLSEYDFVHEHGQSNLVTNFKNYTWTNSKSGTLMYHKFRNKVHHTSAQAVADGLPEWTYVHIGQPYEDIIYREDKEDYLVYTSFIDWHHGYDIAVELANRTKTKVIFITDMDIFSAQASCIQPNEYVEIFNLSNYDPEIANIKKMNLVAGAKALVAPLRDTTFGIVLIEALSAGTPCLVYKDDNPVSFPPAEIIHHGKTGFVGTTIEDFIENCGNVKSIIPNDCRQSVIDEYSQDTMTEGYLKIYDRILKGETW